MQTGWSRSSNLSYCQLLCSFVIGQNELLLHPPRDRTVNHGKWHYGRIADYGTYGSGCDAIRLHLWRPIHEHRKLITQSNGTAAIRSQPDSNERQSRRSNEHYVASIAAALTYGITNGLADSVANSVANGLANRLADSSADGLATVVRGSDPPVKSTSHPTLAIIAAAAAANLDVVAPIAAASYGTNEPNELRRCK